MRRVDDDQGNTLGSGNSVLTRKILGDPGFRVGAIILGEEMQR